MNYVNWIGLLAAAFIVASLAAVPFKSVKKRWGAVLTASVILLCPFNAAGESAAMKIFAFTDLLSISLIFYTGWSITTSKPLFRISELILSVLLGSALILTEAGFVPYDLYRWGYDSRFVAALTGLGILLLNWKKTCFLLAGYGLFRLGIYANIFDVFWDPVFWLVSIILLLQHLFRNGFSVPRSKEQSAHEVNRRADNTGN